MPEHESASHAPHIAPLTDSTSGGAPDDEVMGVDGTGDDLVINDNFRELTAKVNELVARVNLLLS